jgi:hypothetical protein
MLQGMQLPIARLQGSCRGPDTYVYIPQIGEERELFFNLLWWL